MRQGPLAGLKVVEMAGLGPGPLAGQLMADLGAHVVVIDRKSGKADKTDINRRGKRSAALNLKTAEGVDAALRIIENADILIEGFRPGVMEKLGLGPEICHRRNPGLIFGRMTGWGQDGPLAQTAGHDINYLAITGALHAFGKRGEPPVAPLNLAADYAGGTMFLLLGVLSALFERSRSGKGQVVDAAMIEGVPALMGLIHGFLAKGLWTHTREDNLLDGAAPFYRCYETADGKYLSVGPLEPQFFTELMQKAGFSAEHCSDQMDKSNWPERSQNYAALFKTKTRDEWMEIFDGSDACVAPVLNFSEIETHPQNAARKVFQRVDGVMQATPAPRFDRTPAGPLTAPGAPGADTKEILTESGMEASQIDALEEKDVLT